MGRQPCIVAHMTNADIIPALSFATFSLDFEDKYGATDFQDRFRTDFILADCEGVVVIPSAIRDEVRRKCQEKLEGENTVREELASGRSPRAVFDEYGIL
jgi:hypothetical protein